MAEIFLVHRSEDETLIAPLRQDLVAKGVVSPTVDWREGIRQAEKVVCLMTGKAYQDKYVKEARALAKAHGKQIIRIITEGEGSRVLLKGLLGRNTLEVEDGLLGITDVLLQGKESPTQPITAHPQPQSQPQSQPQPQQNQRLTRPKEGRIIGGVAKGLANYWGIQVAGIRIVFIGLTFTRLWALMILNYVTLWIVLPREPKTVEGRKVLWAAVIVTAFILVTQLICYLSGLA